MYTQENRYTMECTMEQMEKTSSRLAHAIRFIGFLDIAIGVFVMNFLAIEWFDSFPDMLSTLFSSNYPLNIVALGIVGVYLIEIWIGKLLIGATCSDFRENGPAIFTTCERWYRYSKFLLLMCLFDFFIIVGKILMVKKKQTLELYLILGGVVGKGLFRIVANSVVQRFMLLMVKIRTIWLEAVAMDTRNENTTQIPTAPSPVPIIMPGRDTYVSISVFSDSLPINPVPAPPPPCPLYEPPPTYEEATSNSPK